MDLVPYSSRDSREIVLRHNDAIVIRDPQTQQLMIRGVTSSFSECPTCHRPLRSPSPDRQNSPHRSPAPFINPDYFRMLHNAYAPLDDHEPPPSPIRRLVQPAFPSSAASSTGGSVSPASGAEFVTSSPAPQTGHRIKKEAFSPNYFKRFFIEEKELGRGGKGIVLLVRHELDGVSLGQFACKRVPVGDDHAWLEKVLIEVQLLQGLSHPNLVSYRHVWLEDVTLNQFSPSVPCAFILQQYCNSGDLHQYIVGPGPAVRSPKEQLKEQMRRRSRGQTDLPDFRHIQRKLAFEEIYSFFKDITSGLAHLHNSNFIHRDLKPSNCLLHKDGNEFKCLISDFGEVQPENMVRKSTGSTGTISYCAPEVLRQDEFGRYGNFTTKSDIFSLGMILYFMCFGRLPYANANTIQEEYEDIDLLRAEISGWSGYRDERRERPELPNQLYQFLKRLLALNPADRPSAGEILTAIHNEKGLKPPQARNPSNPGLGGRIIQSLDSPMPPSTPANEPSKRVRSPAYIEEPSFPDTTSADPSPSQQLIMDQNRHGRTQSRSRSRHLQAIPTLDPTIKTPLLMPPPQTRFEYVKHQFFIAKHYSQAWAVRHQDNLRSLTRVVIFALKMLSITRWCIPLVMREIVWWPLVLLAATEMAMGSKVGWRANTILAAIHIAVLLVVLRYGGGLCARDINGLHAWDWTEE